MDSFIRLYGLYYKINTWSILKPVYFGKFRFGLWGSLIALLVYVGGLIVFRGSPWLMIPFCLVVLLWMTQHFKALKDNYGHHYIANKDRLAFYGKDYQYLRYCIFKEAVVNDQLMADLKDALAHVDVELETDHSTVASSHPFFAGGVALLLGIVGGSVGAWQAQVTLMTVAALFVIIAFAYLILSTSKTPSGRLKEFKRFLHWLRLDEQSSTV
jgi:hypothetical protein